MFPALACTAMLLRVGGGLSKYAVWAIMAVIVEYARRCTTIVPETERLRWWPLWGWPAALAAAAGLTATLAIRQKKGGGASGIVPEPRKRGGSVSGQ